MTTTKYDIATAEPAAAAPFVRFPDHQITEETVTTYNYLFYPALPAALARHLGNAETTLVASEFAAALFATASRQGLRYPDLLIAFDVDPKAFEARNGYLIPEQGKPPDFVLEVASQSTGTRGRNRQARRLRGDGRAGVLAVRPHGRRVSQRAAGRRQAG